MLGWETEATVCAEEWSVERLAGKKILDNIFKSEVWLQLPARACKAQELAARMMTAQ